nr:MAG TPA: hypothetical protein [Caudoviricetes sp.]
MIIYKLHKISYNNNCKFILSNEAKKRKKAIGINLSGSLFFYA